MTPRFQAEEEQLFDEQLLGDEHREWERDTSFPEVPASLLVRQRWHVTCFGRWEAPEYIAPIVALGLPRHGAGWGACELSPEGVSHTKHIFGAITMSSIRELIGDMSGSEAVKSKSISGTRASNQ